MFFPKIATTKTRSINLPSCRLIPANALPVLKDREFFALKVGIAFCNTAFSFLLRDLLFCIIESMEHLNKTQIVLLTLLVSFVTSIATGIVTVTLMDQAPPGVTQTINRVVEKTIQVVVPGEGQKTTIITKTIITKEEDLIVSAIEQNTKSIVRLVRAVSGGKEESLGMGVVISDDGLVVTDKAKMAGADGNLFALYGSRLIPIEIVYKDSEDFVIVKMDLAYSATEKPSNESDGESGEISKEEEKLTLASAALADSDSIKLGQTIIVLGGENGATVFIGIVSRLDTETVAEGEGDATEERLAHIRTTVPIDKASVGGPLINTDGDVMGINIFLSDGTFVAVPINEVKRALESLIDVVVADDENGGVQEMTVVSEPDSRSL
ncbi:MAG: hypothetical protein BMS9Abin13_351 [Patescibacteria group bacterium]|nr:MAG: hypothetical protein BMS9Abin13_351 [Patescibacteria group bacterium]